MLNPFRSRRAREEELDEEIQSHLNMAERDRVERGEEGESARNAARREFGNAGLVKEITREMWGWRSIEKLQQDLRYGIRTLRKNLAFTAVAVLSIALGVGANTAIFSVINAVMLKSLPVKNSQSLVVVGSTNRVGSVSEGGGRADLFSYQFFQKFRERQEVFSDVYATGRSEALNVSQQRESGQDASNPGDTRGRFVSGNFFQLLGVNALIGRTITPADDRVAGGAPVTVMSYGYWEREFGRDPNIVGKNLVINGSSFTVIGVTPRDFFGDIVGRPTDLWFPITMQAQANPGHDYLKAASISWLLMMGRLKPSVSVKQAEAGVNVATPAIFEELFKPTESPEGLAEILKQRVPVSAGARGFSRLRDEFSAPLMMLMGIVGLILLICCANVANLQLARAVSRNREMGLRVALGAGRTRLIRQLLTESFLLALTGGGAGLVVAFWGSRLLVRLVSGDGPLPLEPGLDARVLIFTGAISIVAGLLFGLAPAWRATRMDVVTSLKESTSGQADGFTRVFGRLLIVAQIVFSLIVVVAAGLFIRTLRNLEHVDVGYQREGLLLLRVDPPAAGYDDPKINEMARGLIEKLQQIPGVEAVTVSENGLFSGTNSQSDAKIEGYTATGAVDRQNDSDRVGPNYFAIVGTPILAGRGFGPQDNENAPKVAVVNQSFARYYFPNASPIGHHLIFDADNSDGKGPVPFEIVGVVRDVKEGDLREPVPRRFYTPYLQHQAFDPLDAANVEIRTTMPSASLSKAVRQAIHEFNPSLPIWSVETADELIDDTLTQEHMIAQLSSFFGVLALILAAIGIYGVMSYITARRTAEIGIRLALGAERISVMGMVLKDTLRLVAVGLLVGVVASALTAKLFAGTLFGLGAFDPVTTAVAAGVITLAASLAAYLPALRAARVSPTVALRYE
jgi:predicted permease